jgi:hypothetical protein
MGAISELLLTALRACSASYDAPNVALMVAHATFTTSGAIDSYAGSTKGTVVAKPAGTGLYTVTFPACKALRLAAPAYHQASGVDMRLGVVSVVPTTGVVTLQCSKESTSSDDFEAADATTGDAFDLIAYAEY